MTRKSCTLLCLLVVCCSISLPVHGAALGGVEALERAWSYLETMGSLQFYEQESYTFTASLQDTWHILCTRIDDSSLSCIVILNENGTLRKLLPKNIELRYMNYIVTLRTEILARTEEWEHQLGLPHSLWGYEKQAAFVEAYGGAPGYYSATLPGLPSESDLTEQQALDAARAYLLRDFGQTEAALDALRTATIFYPDKQYGVLETRLHQGPVWVVTHHKNEPENQYPTRFQVNLLSPSGTIYLALDENTGMFFELFTEKKDEGAQATSDPSLRPDSLFYDPNGGLYYHIVDDCVTVDPQYLPLVALDRTQLDTAPYQDLLPCEVCFPGQ